MHNNKRKILLLVEGKKLEVKLFSRIIECFPELPVTKNDIIVYNTNLWNLNNALTKEFGEKWYEEEIDFIGFLKSSVNTKEQINSLMPDSNDIDAFESLKFRDVFLVFDYERQDPNFDEHLISKMLAFWNQSSENGLLYINYPMLEAFKHVKTPLPDKEFLTRKCNCVTLFSKENHNNMYKQIVSEESSFTDLRKLNRDILKALVVHNICKVSEIVDGVADLTDSFAEQYWGKIDLNKTLYIQSICSQDSKNGFVYVLATCLFFIPEYNTKLIFF